MTVAMVVLVAMLVYGLVALAVGTLDADRGRQLAEIQVDPNMADGRPRRHPQRESLR
jgi:hypothetical protein